MRKQVFIVSKSIGVGLTLVIGFSVLLSWAAPANPILNPSRNSHTAQPTSIISITYDEPISVTTVTSHTFVVQAMQSGLLTATHSVSGGTIIVTPLQPFHQGELVYVIATTNTLSINGTPPLSSTQWQFTAGTVTSRYVKEFTKLSTSLTPLYWSSVAWGDYDNDSDLDILTTGGKATNVYLTEVWRNDGGENFTKIPVSIGGYRAGSADWGDYDNDGDLDILFSGWVNPTLNIETTEIWRNDGGDNFSKLSTSLTGVRSSSTAWGDYDNDGDLDILLSGWTGSTRVTEIWRNDGGGTFVKLSTSLTGLVWSSVAWGDYDNDGDLDILMSGFNNSYARVTELWRNDGGGNFTKLSTNITGVSGSSIAWGDYDNDGDLDILLSGYGDTYVTEIWRNDSGGNFVKLSTSLTNLSSGSANWGDYDNDGDLDILISGDSGGIYVTEIWRNDSAGSFSRFSTSLTGVYDGEVIWGDYDQDGDLDILLSGEKTNRTSVTEVWRNESYFYSYLPLILYQP